MASGQGISENIYGHLARLAWFKRYLQQNDKVAEFGCGTGCMITLPLAQAGVDIHGFDLDQESITYGREAFLKEEQDPLRLHAEDIGNSPHLFDVVIASEVLEHIPNSQMPHAFDALKKALKPGGELLVTVPNGYGWFELESWLYFKLGLGTKLEQTKIPEWIYALKVKLRGGRLYQESPYQSSLADSPHVQRFTWRSIRKLLEKNGFEVLSGQGSVLFAGPFSHNLFSGLGPIMAFNRFLGRVLPWTAAGFYVRARLRRVDAPVDASA